MNSKQFDKILNDIVVRSERVLGSKKKEYASGDRDRLDNFNRAALMLGISREEALLGMWAKHMVSIITIVEDMKKGIKPSLAMIEEKWGDEKNYMILMEAMVKEDCGYISDEKSK